MNNNNMQKKGVWLMDRVYGNKQFRGKSKCMIVFVLLLMCMLVPSLTAEAKWVKDGKKYRYTINDSGTKYYKNGWVKIKGKYYYFDEDGYRKTGWLTYKGNKFYLNKSGVRVTGFQTIKNKR